MARFADCDDWLSMRSRFRVGGHLVEVETGHWSGLEIYRVDGEERLRKRYLGWHPVEAIEVAGHEVEVSGRWYPFTAVTVDVDGVRRVDDLFPQLRWLVQLIALVSGTLMAVLSASIAWDLWRWSQLG